MQKQLIGKFVKGFVFGLIPIVLVTLKQHGCEVDNWQALGGDLALALIPATGHAIWNYVYPSKTIQSR